MGNFRKTKSLSGAFNSRYAGYARAKKIYRCVRCSHCAESPKPTTCPMCGFKNFLKFDSKIEYNRYCELLLMQNCGLVRNLQTQVNFPLSVNGLLVCTYRADSVYYDIKKNCEVIEDVKPNSEKAIDQIFKLKARLFECLKGFSIKIHRR